MPDEAPHGTLATTDEVAIFDAGNWLITKCPGGYVLTNDTIRAVSSFTLMWNLFENTVCGNYADIKTLEQVATDIVGHQPDLPDEIRAGVQFWSNRYLENHKFNYLFDGLNFRKGDRRAHVEAVLSGTATDALSQLLGAFIIVYRLRNNLFHGLKEIGGLNDQIGNLDMACRVLAGAMLISGKLP